MCVYKCADSKRDGNNLHKRAKNSRGVMTYAPSMLSGRGMKERIRRPPGQTDIHSVYTVYRYKATYRFENMSYNMGPGHVLQH